MKYKNGQRVIGQSFTKSFIVLNGCRGVIEDVNNKTISVCFDKKFTFGHFGIGKVSEPTCRWFHFNKGLGDSNESIFNIKVTTISDLLELFS